MGSPSPRTALLATCACALLTAGTQIANAPEISTKADSLVFKAKVNLIMVPVVVRDKHDKVVTTLRQEDFQLFDKGKPQVISSFSIEKSGGKALPPIPLVGGIPAAQPGLPPVMAPDRYIGILIDDMNTAFEDISYTRSKLKKFIDTRLQSGDRAAVFTTSGSTFLDFTDDRDKLDAVALKITPHPPFVPPTCPGMTILVADRIANMGDGDWLKKKAIEAWQVDHCAKDLPEGISQAMSAAQRIMAAVKVSARDALAKMASVVRVMGEKPGQRILVLASAGFIRPSPDLQDSGAIIDQAIRSRVIINSIDARGLVASPGGVPLNLEQETRQSDILWELADGTGGKFIHNTNDIEGGFVEVAAAPEVTYMLGFSPQNLKLDGSYHALKVALKVPAGMSVQFRRGYYAPTHLADSDENAKEEVREALFSQEETHDIAIDMTTQFFKSSATEAKLSILSRIDVSKLHYRKTEGRNVDDIKLVCGLFDRDGNFVDAVAQTISLRLLDETLKNRVGSGLPVRADFTVAPGTYVIRLVARDSEGEMITAQSGAVEIPR